MTKEEKIKYGYELMVKNNPDEAVKELIKLELENKRLNNTLVKIIGENIVVRDRLSNAIEYIEDKNNEVIGILENNKDTFVKKQDLLNILRGESNE